MVDWYNLFICLVFAGGSARGGWQEDCGHFAGQDDDRQLSNGHSQSTVSPASQRGMHKHGGVCQICGLSVSIPSLIVISDYIKVYSLLLGVELC